MHFIHVPCVELSRMNKTINKKSLILSAEERGILESRIRRLCLSGQSQQCWPTLSINELMYVGEGRVQFPLSVLVKVGFMYWR